MQKNIEKSFTPPSGASISCFLTNKPIGLTGQTCADQFEKLLSRRQSDASRMLNFLAQFADRHCARACAYPIRRHLAFKFMLGDDLSE